MAATPVYNRLQQLALQHTITLINRRGSPVKILHAFRIRLYAAIIVAAVAIPAWAHHSFTMFDMSKHITITGTVTSFEWTNPHSYIEIDVPDRRVASNTGVSNSAAQAF